MIRIDGERTFQPIHRTRTHDGDEREVLSSDHTRLDHRAGVRTAIKASAQRRDRRVSRVQLSRYTTI
jgi:predicted xylose isomerase-like sugar epimerase